MSTETETAKLLHMPIEELGLTVRPHNCLKRAAKNKLKDIIELTEVELRQVKSLGRKSAEEIKDKLAHHGLKLRGAV